MMSDQTDVHTIEDEIFEILDSIVRLRARPMAPSDDLYAAGLSSLATVDLMLAIEDRFGIEFTTEWLNRRTFGSVAMLRQAVVALKENAP
ncbi:MAG: acyl carrier protein [Janthinobacterium lividum]